VLAPDLARALEENLPAESELTAQDVAMGILRSIVIVRPDFGPMDALKAFAALSTHIGMQYFPKLLRPFAPED